MEHPKVQSAGSFMRINKVDPGPGFDGSGRKWGQVVHLEFRR